MATQKLLLQFQVQCSLELEIDSSQLTVSQTQEASSKQHLAIKGVNLTIIPESTVSIPMKESPKNDK